MTNPIEELYSFKQLNDNIRSDFVYLREKMSDIKFGISEESAEKLIIKCIGKHIQQLQAIQPKGEVDIDKII